MSIFTDRVIKVALAIPRGRVSTYGRIARAAGAGGMAAQSVTSVLARAYDAGETRIPFHRIVYADGHIWVNPKERNARMKLYKQEGIFIDARDKVRERPSHKCLLPGGSSCFEQSIEGGVDRL